MFLFLAVCWTVGSLVIQVVRVVKLAFSLLVSIGYRVALNTRVRREIGRVGFDREYLFFSLDETFGFFLIEDAVIRLFVIRVLIAFSCRI